MTAPSRPSNCSPLSPYRQCCSGMIFGSSTAGHSFLDIACRGKGDCLQGKRGIRAAGVLASESALRSEIGWSWGTPTLHQTIAKPLYQDRNWWILGAHPNRKTPLSGPKLVGYGAHLAPRHHRKTRLSGPKLVDSGAHTASQNPFMRSIAKPLCQDRILPLGHYSDLILGKVKTSKRPCKRFRVTVSKPEARFGVAACPKAKLP